MASSSNRAMPTSPKKSQKSAKDKAAERVMKKERATQELVSTEVTYNTQLGLLIAHYVQPLSDYKLISSEQHSILFPQVQIIKGLSDTFLADLNKRRSDWDPKSSKLSDLFEKFTPYFRMYQGYVNNHEKALEMMRKLQDKEKWNEYCQSVRSDCKGYDLARYQFHGYSQNNIHKHYRTQFTHTTHSKTPSLSIAISRNTQKHSIRTSRCRKPEESTG